jgi:hypothetical protein
MLARHRAGYRIVAGLALVAAGVAATVVREGVIWWGAVLVGLYLAASGARALRNPA